MKYGQFCPIAKASEILGEKWTILIVRELLMGSVRFNELQRGLGTISPTILTKRLNLLVDSDLVYRKRIRGQRGFEYYPTEQCKELLPILLSLGKWGFRWTTNNLAEADYDVELLMLYLERSIVPENLPGNQLVIKFQFKDFDDMANWWITVDGDVVDVCTQDPGQDVDIFITTSVKTMTDAWMGKLSYRQARKNGHFDIHGPTALTRNISSWLTNCAYGELPEPSEILR